MIGVFAVQGSLDSSMKKNTAFIKRLRTAINAPAQAQFLQEIRALSLHKYLSEIISACYEGLCKLKTPGEIAAGVEIVSALHQRFGPAEFTGYIGWYIGRGLATPDKSHWVKLYKVALMIYMHTQLTALVHRPADSFTVNSVVMN